MTFQTTVNADQAWGVVGELFDDGPHRCQPFILNSALASYNVFGRAFSILSEGVVQAGNPTGLASFGGILIGPKAAALLGDTSGTLNPSLAQPDYVAGSLLTMGSVWVALAAAANIGDAVVYDNTTGILSTVAPGDVLPTGKSWAYAMVDRFTVTEAGLAVIKITEIPRLPVSA